MPAGILGGRPIRAAGTFSVTPLEQKVIEAAYEDDRQWLSDHPDRECRVRPALPGEVPAGAVAEGCDQPGIGEAWYVWVRRDGGLGSRVYRVMPEPAPEDVRIDPIGGSGA